MTGRSGSRAPSRSARGRPQRLRVVRGKRRDRRLRARRRNRRALQTSCLSRDGTGGACSPVPRLAGPATGMRSSSFGRDAGTGALAHSAASASAEAPRDARNVGRSTASFTALVTPDGKNVYVASAQRSNAVAAFAGTRATAACRNSADGTAASARRARAGDAETAIRLGAHGQKAAKKLTATQCATARPADRHSCAALQGSVGVFPCSGGRVALPSACCAVLQQLGARFASAGRR